MGREPGELADLLVTRYPPGAGIGWHRDAPQVRRGRRPLAAAACRMRFRAAEPAPGRQPNSPCSPAPPTSCPGPARTQWQHNIPPVTHERWSVTFRTLRHARPAPGERADAGHRTRPPRARTERLEWDGSTLQLWVREPPADGRANAAVIRAVAR